MTSLDHSNPRKHPGSGTTNPFSGGPDWYPLNHVTVKPRVVV